MAVKLSDLPTLAQLYTAGELQPVKTSYKSTSSLLDQISFYEGDICKLELDSIVNAANRYLMDGSGVTGAIFKAAGPGLAEECKKLKGCPTGEAKITQGYDLPSKHVIHTVGPIYQKYDTETAAKLLASCYKASLDLAVNNSLHHIAFPSISTGIYGFPVEGATDIALHEVRQFCDSVAGGKLERIVFVVLSEKKDVYKKLIPQYFPPLEEGAVGDVQGCV